MQAMPSDLEDLVQGLVRTCDSEPIHIPGAIQPHGLLLLFDAESGTLARWAGDFDRLLGNTPAVGRCANDLLGATLDELTGARLLIPGEEAVHIGCVRPGDRASLAMLVHRTGRFLAIELLPSGKEGSAIPALEQVRSISHRVAAMPTLADACGQAAEQVRSITGFDRVMVYRFLENDSGAVIAESRTADSPSYYDHRFPASDIPRQARDLYRRNLIRTIPDVAYTPMPVEPPAGDSPLDMSHCALRSVSPVHIQYLKNMDVGASMSISLLVGGELWGLIACHHRSARPVSVEAQLLCRHVGTTLSDFILSFGQAEGARLAAVQAVGLEAILQSLRSSSDPERTLRTSAQALKGMIDCGGFVLLADGELVAGAGRFPGPDELRELAPRLSAQLRGRQSYFTDRIGKALPGSPGIESSASGVLAIRLEGAEPLLALWLRPEQVEEISWAGDPRDKQEPTERLEPLTPRRSFATWREIVRGRSRPWLWHEINAAELFRARAGYTMQRHRLKQLNVALGQANALLSALATMDPLTGLSNRRLFDERFEVEWQRATRQGKSLAVIVIDVDNFKAYNDCFGHPAGDECLKQIAGAINAERRSIDVAARIGGEEFVLLLPDIGSSGAAAVAERVRKAIERLGLEHPNTESGVVTISLGAAAASPAQMEDASHLMNAADQALYKAKADGRNRVAVSA